MGEESSTVEKELEDNDLKSMKILLFGDEKEDFPSSWTKHGFCFKTFPPYRLEQVKSGPCGVIAAVAAHVLDELIFGSIRIVLKEGLLRPTFGERKLALSKALTQIIWRARSGCVAVVVANNVITEENDKDKIKLRNFDNEDMLCGCINTNITLFKKKWGIALFMYSLLLTRGIEEIKSDMDFPDKLIGEDG